MRLIAWSSRSTAAFSAAGKASPRISAADYLSCTNVFAAVSAGRKSAAARAPPSFLCYHAPAG